VQPLRRPENFACEAMGNHDVVADFDSEHAISFGTLPGLDQ
jgi:hypothetical protein